MSFAFLCVCVSLSVCIVCLPQRISFVMAISPRTSFLGIWIIMVPHLLCHIHLVSHCPSSLPIFEPLYFQGHVWSGSCCKLSFIYALPENCHALYRLKIMPVK